VLAERYLRRAIQQGSHDSVVDARTALDLAVLKISHGPSFGTNEGQASDKLVDVVAAHGHRCCLVDRQDVLRRFASSSASAVPCFSDAHCVAELRKQLAPKRHSLVWGQLMALQHFFYERSQRERRAAAQQARQHEQQQEHEQREQQQQQQAQQAQQAQQQQKQGQGKQQQQQEQQQQQGQGQQQGEDPGGGGGEAEEVHDYSEEALLRVAQQLDEHVGQLYDALPPNSLLIVATGQGDTAECRRQQELKYRRQNGLDGLPRWSQAAEEEFGELCDRVMRGLCFAAVKQ
jgi:RNA exonuclease 1